MHKKTTTPTRRRMFPMSACCSAAAHSGVISLFLFITYSISEQQDVWISPWNRSDPHRSGSAGINHHPASQHRLATCQGCAGARGDNSWSGLIYSCHPGTSWVGSGQPGKL